MDYISRIPPEILREILIYVTYMLRQPYVLNLRTVCKKFRDVVDKLSYWGKLNYKLTINTFQDLLTNLAVAEMPVRNWIIRNSACELVGIYKDQLAHPCLSITKNDFYIIEKPLYISQSRLIRLKIRTNIFVNFGVYLFDQNKEGESFYSERGIYHLLYMHKCMNAENEIVIRQKYNKLNVHFPVYSFHHTIDNNVHIAIKFEGPADILT